MSSSGSIQFLKEFLVPFWLIFREKFFNRANENAGNIEVEAQFRR
jgi:hypothetical protein